VVVGPLPPPVHGQSKNTALVVDELRRRCCVRVGDTSPGRLSRGLAYHATKAKGILKAIALILLGAFRAKRSLYVTVGSGSGLWYDLVVVTVGRSLGYTVYLHHRSFSYIDRPLLAMRAVRYAAGISARHIFLCDAMSRLFVEAYGFVREIRVVSNMATLSESPDQGPLATDSAPLRLGLLSNLTAEKGLHDFLRLLAAARAHGLPYVGVLGGPCPEPADQRMLAAAQRASAGALDYRGPLDALARTDFYRDIDIFVFPTRYAVEAQPNVLFEAFAHARAVLTTARGCIGSDVPSAAGHVIPADADFVASALPILRAWSDDRAGLRRVQLAAYGHVEAEQALASSAHRALLDEIAQVSAGPQG
jgi:glycosyltransferase involved in cell wall biosynthesis